MKKAGAVLIVIATLFIVVQRANAGQIIHAQSDSLKLSTVLQSHMVVQQNKPFKIWGTAAPDAKVTIKPDWMKSAIHIEADAQGRFMGIVDVPVAKKGDYGTHEILVSSNRQQILLNDLLIGDLWFLSGQSNMQFAVHEMIDSTAIIAAANNPHIRLLNVALNFSKEPVNYIKGKWKQCSSANVRDFSAVGYSFGARLQRELDIPIGLIFSGIGASGVQAYVPKEVLANDSLLNRVYLEPYLKDPKSEKPVNAGFSFEKVVRPFLLYNALIHPFTRLSIKGFCWYQGESNNKDRESYTLATIKMITAWRDRFEQGPLPFEFVQIAPYFHEKEDSTLAYDAFFREAQEHILELNNTAMVLTMDVGDGKNLHPKNKLPIGNRLAQVALNRTYNRLEVPYLGPHYNYATFKNDEVVIHFTPETIRKGLNTKDGKDPKFFFIAGADSVFYPAKATIVGGTVVIKSDKVKRPIAVRYAFFNYPITNLQNGDDFPAVPFRTDNWPEKMGVNN